MRLKQGRFGKSARKGAIMMHVSELINRDIHCTCGRRHRCDIPALEIGEGALARLPHMTDARHILLVADRNTYPLCGERVLSLLGGEGASSQGALPGGRIENICLFDTCGLLVPDEAAVARLRASLTDETDLVLGIGSGVINDLCKYVSFERGIPSGIIATAPSMDGYASSGAAMIFGGMKVTKTTHAPALILGDTDLLAAAPAEMIQSGFADIIGKYSALSDWKLAERVTGEYLCPEVYRIVLAATNEVRGLAAALVRREKPAIGRLFEILVLVGVCLTLLSTTRPGSGSEHHLSHYFEITGLIHDKPYFLHGIDVGYSTVVTAGMREEILALPAPVFCPQTREEREAAWQSIYGPYWREVRDLQEDAGRYREDPAALYAGKWEDVRGILAECPGAQEIREMLTSVGIDLAAFEKMYGAQKIRDGMFFAKDLKDRYSVLWLWSALFPYRPLGSETVARMRACMTAERNALNALLDGFDEAGMRQAGEILKRAPLTVTSACGSSGFAAKKFAHSLCCVGRPAKFVPPGEAVHGGMGALAENGALVLVSKGGQSEELLPLLDVAHAKHARVILLTANPGSELAAEADVTLRLPDVPEGDVYGVMSTASFAATIAIFDALFVSLIEETGFSLRDFALIHPGGAVGKQITAPNGGQ